MPARTSPLLLLLAFSLAAGCAWEGRPDGAEAVHSASDGFGDLDPTATPLGGVPLERPIVEPLDGPNTLPGPVADAPVPITQPPPTTGTDDQVSPVEEALTPGL